jgi:two-component system sensor histidine kinase/response regulator
VLLVEDNRVNQTMAQRTLGKRGHQVTVAENGRDALDALDRDPAFDVVLMDVQMPVMNGLQATVRIRVAEQESGRHLPIVAMTAHAMRGDRERCLAAGMDGYLVKPIQADELIAALESFVGPPAPNEAAGAAAEPVDIGPARTAMLDHLGGDLGLATELAHIFLEDRAAMMARIEAAIEARDAGGLRVAAHTLKGAVGNFGAAAVAAAALRLEKMGASGSLDEAAAARDVLKREMAGLDGLLRSIVQPSETRSRTRSPKSVPTARRAAPKRRRARAKSSRRPRSRAPARRAAARPATKRKRRSR